MTSPKTVVGALDAERIKLSTIRSPRWACVAAAVCSLGVAWLQGGSAYGEASLGPENAVVGVAVFGVPVLMILSAMVVTGEYRSGMIYATFSATPGRTTVLIAKALVAASFSGLFTAALVVGAVTVARLTADPLEGTRLSLTEPGVWRTVGAMAVFAALAAVLGVATGALLRHTAGAVAVLLLWPLVLEPILGNMPSVGSDVGPFLPFGNAFLFANVRWLYPDYSMPWGPLGSLVYFALIVAVVFLAATVTVNRRDA